MKKLTAISLGSFALGLILATPVFADDVNERMDAASDGHVDVSNIAGSIVVNGWSRNEVEVTGELGRNVEKLIFERNKDKITIKVKVPRKGGHGIDSDLRISVPQNSSIDVGTVSADIDVTDVLGEQKLNTVSGDVTTESSGADVTAGSVSGDVEIAGDGSNNETGANTVSGDVTVFRVAGEIRAESVSGDVVVDEGAFDRAALNTVNGEIIFEAELRNGGRFASETVNGDIDVEFVGDLSARIEIDTFNGSIRNCFGPKAERTSKYTPGWELSFTEGGGDGRVEMSTMNGDLSLCRK